MASSLNRFGALAVRHSFRTRPQSVTRPLPHSAFLHQSAVRRDNGSDSREKVSGRRQQNAPGQGTPPTQASDANDDAEIVNYGEVAEGSDPFWGFPNTMSIGERNRIKKEMENFIENPPEEQKVRVRQWRREVAALEQKYLREFEKQVPAELPVRQERDKEGLLGMGEDHPEDQFEDPEFEGDDIASGAHGDLEQHREIREYMRIAAWEMPLLSKYAQKFELPTNQPLRFRHTSYLGETHPAQQKIVVEFCTADLPLTPAQRLKLIKLVGVRYDPRKDLVKMSCEMFETAAQNKRYLGDLVDTLVLEAKNESSAEGAKDKFEDIPPDFRHVRWKKRLAFPNAWKMTPEKQATLDRERQQGKLAEQDRRDSGQLVNGPELIGTAMKSLESGAAQVVVEQARAGVAPARPRA